MNCIECNTTLTKYNRRKSGFRIKIGLLHFAIYRLCDNCTPRLFNINWNNKNKFDWKDRPRWIK